MRAPTVAGDVVWLAVHAAQSRDIVGDRSIGSGTKTSLDCVYTPHIIADIETGTLPVPCVPSLTSVARL